MELVKLLLVRWEFQLLFSKKVMLPPNYASVSRIPRVRILEDEEGAKDIELSDDPYDCIRLSVENVPCIVTLCKV